MNVPLTEEARAELERKVFGTDRSHLRERIAICLLGGVAVGLIEPLAAVILWTASVPFIVRYAIREWRLGRLMADDRDAAYVEAARLKDARAPADDRDTVGIATRS